MRVIVTTAHVPFTAGGAEVLAEDLVQALMRAGHETELLRIPFVAYPPSRILDSMLACRLIDLSDTGTPPPDLVIGLKFPAYLVQHPNKTMWLCHQERSVYELWDSQFNGLRSTADGPVIREAIVAADLEEFSRLEKIFTISKNVSRRLSRYSSVDSTVLYPPARHAERYACTDYEPFLFYPSRIAPLKRHELVLRGLATTSPDVRLVISGKSDEPRFEQRLRALATELSIDDRVEFIGWIPEDEKINLYGRCRGVVFPPFDEDYGYVSIEAMLAEKPIVTCSDSGGTLEFVIHNETGMIADPNPESLGAAMTLAWDPKRARLLGRAGRMRHHEQSTSWESIVETITSAA